MYTTYKVGKFTYEVTKDTYDLSKKVCNGLYEGGKAVYEFGKEVHDGVAHLYNEMTASGNIQDEPWTLVDLDEFNEPIFKEEELGSPQNTDTFGIAKKKLRIEWA